VAPAAASGNKLAALIALAGGAVAVGSALLPWAVSGSGDSYFKAIDVTDTSDLANGYFLIAAGAVAAVCGLLLLLGMARSSGLRLLLSLGAIAGGAIVLAVEYSAYNHVGDLTSSAASFGYKISVGNGLYLGAAAGAVAVVGGVMGLLSKK
jgi:hypothetical protein